MTFHQGRAAETMGAKEVEQFLTHLAVDRKVSAKSQKQALSALVFLYGTVLGIELGQLMPVRGRHGRRVPVVMTRREVPLVLGQVEGGGGCFRLMCELNVTSLQKAVRAAVKRSGLTKQITPHTFRHSFATHLLETGHNIKKVRELLGHKDIRTTMIYLHVMEGGTTGVRSPLDTLDA